MRLAFLIVAVAVGSSARSSSPSGARDPLAGSWVGTRAKNDLSRISIVRHGRHYEAHVWAFSTFEEIDWGKRPLHLYYANVASKRVSRAIGIWKADFGTDMLILKPNGNTLTVEDFGRFTDKSGRSDSYRAEKLTRRPASRRQHDHRS